MVNDNLHIPHQRAMSSVRYDPQDKLFTFVVLKLDHYPSCVNYEIGNVSYIANTVPYS